MKCTNCGFESELDYPVCPQCQAKTHPNPAAQKILRVLKDPLFLAICILMSISCVLSLATGSLPLINILITVFLGLTYAQSRKEIADANHLRFISGAVYANYVVNYVAAGLVVIVGLLFTVAFGLILGDPEFQETLLSTFTDVSADSLEQIISIIPSGIIMVGFILIAAVLVVLNIFSLRYIHRFTKSIYQCIETGVLNLKYVTATKVWMFIIGGLYAIDCLSDLSDGAFQSLLSNASICAVCILAGLLIHKYLSNEPATSVDPQNGNV